MSGGVKSGLIFAVISVVVVFGISFVPTIGVLCCGPIGAVALGALAGYLGVRWGGTTAGIGQGVLAGGLTGVGALVGAVIFVLAAIALLKANPELYNEMLRQIIDQQPEVGLTLEDLDALMMPVGFVVGLCIGVIELLFALGAGALGGWLAVRQRPAPPMPPMAPPFVPPGASVG